VIAVVRHLYGLVMRSSRAKYKYSDAWIMHETASKANVGQSPGGRLCGFNDGGKARGDFTEALCY